MVGIIQFSSQRRARVLLEGQSSLSTIRTLINEIGRGRQHICPPRRVSLGASALRRGPDPRTTRCSFAALCFCTGLIISHRSISIKGPSSTLISACQVIMKSVEPHRCTWEGNGDHVAPHALWSCCPISSLAAGHRRADPKPSFPCLHVLEAAVRAEQGIPAACNIHGPFGTAMDPSQQNPLGLVLCLGHEPKGTGLFTSAAAQLQTRPHPLGLIFTQSFWSL